MLYDYLKLASLNIDQVNNDILAVIGKGNKERKIFLTPAKKSINSWMQIRNTLNMNTKLYSFQEMVVALLPEQYRMLLKNMLLRPDLIQQQYLLTNSVTRQQRLCINMGGWIFVLFNKSLVMKASLQLKSTLILDDHQLQSAVNSNPLAMMFN